MGRITGSASIETLVRVGIEKEHGLSPDSKMVVLHDFTPCVDDELEVKRGQIVNILYRENDWVYVIGQDTRQEGFIPHSYCAPYNTQLAELAIKKKLPRDQSLGPHANATTADLIDGVPDISNDLLDETTVSGLIGLQSSVLKHSQASLSSEPDFLPFSKDPSGLYVVLYTFIARDENDVSVERGEYVTGKTIEHLSTYYIRSNQAQTKFYSTIFILVLNREDPEWFWIVRSDGQEGFIPSGFVYPADNVLQANTKPTSAINGTLNQLNMNANANAAQNPAMNNDGGVTMTNNMINNAVTSAITTAAPMANTNNVNPNAGGLGGGQPQAMDASDEMRYHGTELVMLYDYKVSDVSSWSLPHSQKNIQKNNAI